MNNEFLDELNKYQIDPLVRNIHLTLEDSQVLQLAFIEQKDFAWTKIPWILAVSYTHLTLPTICSV